MNTHASRTQENKSQSIADAALQKQGFGESTFQLHNNRPEAIAQRKLQEIANNSLQTQKLMQLQNMVNHGLHVNPSYKKTIQLMPATAMGSTHLVAMNQGSIMEGKEGAFIESGTSLDVDPNKRVISRRGPNQELVGDYDKRGKHIYRWYKIDQYGTHNISKGNEYIRESTFKFDNTSSEPKVSHQGLDQHSEHRTRQSHVAVRFEVWFNSNRKIDPAGHLVMADKSKEYRGVPPYYAYEMGSSASPQKNPEGERFKMGEEDNQPKLDGENNQYTGISVKDAREQSKRVTGAFKTLNQPNESKDAIIDRLTDQKRYVSQKTGVGYMQPEDGREEKQRFNEIKWVELLVTRDEYKYLIDMWEERKKHGFYCFIREARTEAKYKYATRCLSSLEDIAISRKQNELNAGHAKDILDQFQKLNRITDEHTGEMRIVSRGTD